MTKTPSQPFDSAASLPELKGMWTSLIEEEEKAFLKCVELDNLSPDRSPEKAEAVRKWWRIVNSVLWMFVRTRAQHDHELQPYPAFTLGRLANISEEIANGNIPSFVQDARKAGRSLWRKERQSIAYGILYIEAVKRGDISDHAPNQTVRRLYNVTAKAVQGWMKRRDEICVGVPDKHLSDSELTEKMRESAEIYSKLGRGAPAEN